MPSGMAQPAMKADCEPLLRPVTAFLDILDRVTERNARARCGANHGRNSQMSEKCLVVIYGASGYTAGMIAEDLRERVELSTATR